MIISCPGSPAMELRPLLELFQRRGSRKKFMEYLEQNEEYWDMDDESWHMLGQLTNFKNIENFMLNIWQNLFWNIKKGELQSII